MISTHILDTRIGKPAANVSVSLEKRNTDGVWHQLALVATNADGRIADFKIARESGSYRLLFSLQAYFNQQQIKAFYSEIIICFEVDNGNEHYHVPLLLNPFGYSTYRGS